MFKYSTNILVKSIDTEYIEAIQSKGGNDYRVKIKVPNNGKIAFCVPTDQFISIYEEGIGEISQSEFSVTIEGPCYTYRLGILKERGTFLVEPEVTILENDPVKDSWDYDFSGKSLNTKINSFDQAPSRLIVIGKDFISRNKGNLFEFYGDPDTVVASVMPSDFNLLSKLGKCSITIYESKKLRAINDKGEEVRLVYTTDPIKVKSALSLISGSPTFSVDLSGVKLKSMNKFILEKIFFSLKTGSATFTTESARKSFEVPDLVLDKQIDFELFSKDLPLFTGKLDFYDQNKEYKPGQEVYAIVSKAKDKTTCLMYYTALGTIAW